MRRSRTARTSPPRQSEALSRARPCGRDTIAPIALILGADRRGLRHRPRARLSMARDATRSVAPRSRRRRSAAGSRRRCRSPRACAGSWWTPAAPASRARSSRGTHSGGSAPRASRPRHGSSGCRPHGVRPTSGAPASRSSSPDAANGVLPAGSRSSYLPATLVSGFPPMSDGRDRPERRTGDRRGARACDAPQRRRRDRPDGRRRRDARALPRRAGAESDRRGAPPRVRGAVRPGRDAACGGGHAGPAARGRHGHHAEPRRRRRRSARRSSRRASGSMSPCRSDRSREPREPCRGSSSAPGSSSPGSRQRSDSTPGGEPAHRTSSTASSTCPPT